MRGRSFKCDPRISAPDWSKLSSAPCVQEVFFSALTGSKHTAAIFDDLFSSLLTLSCPASSLPAPPTLPLPLPVAPPSSLSLSGTVAGGGAKKRLTAPSLSLTLSRRDSQDPSSEGLAALSATPDDTPSLDINLEALETPSGSESGTLPELEWEGETRLVAPTFDLSPDLMTPDLSLSVSLCGRRPPSDGGEGQRCRSGGQEPHDGAVRGPDGAGPSGQQGAPLEEVLHIGPRVPRKHECAGTVPASPVAWRSEVTGGHCWVRGNQVIIIFFLRLGEMLSAALLMCGRLLRRRDERHHPVHLLLPAGEHSGGLRLRHGPPVQVGRAQSRPAMGSKPFATNLVHCCYLKFKFSSFELLDI